MTDKRITITLDGDPQGAVQAGDATAKSLDRVADAQDKVAQSSSRHQAAADRVIDGLNREASAAASAETSLISKAAALERVAEFAGRAGAVIAATAITMVTLGVQAETAAEKIDNKLTAVLRATQVQTGYTREGLDQLASSLAEVTQFDDDAFKNATATVLRFGEVTGQRLERTLKLSADLAAVMGGDLASASATLGRSLASPEQGIERLQRSIGYLDEAEIKAIKAMAELGDTAQAQERILAILEKRIGGTAEIINSGYTKAFESATKAQDDFFKSIGKISVVKETTISFWEFVTSSFKDLQRIVETGDWVEKVLRVGAFLGGWRGVGGDTPTAPPKPTVDKAKAEKEEAERKKKFNAALAEQDAEANEHLAKIAKKAGEERLKELKKLQEKDFESRKAYYDALEDQAAKEGQIALRQQKEQNKAEEQQLKKHLEGELKAYVAQTDAINEEYIRRGQEANRARLEAINNDRSVWNDVSNRGVEFLDRLLERGGTVFDKLTDMVKDFGRELLAVFAKRWILQAASNIPGLGHLSTMAGQVGQGTAAGGVADWLGMSGANMPGLGMAAAGGAALGSIGTRALGAGQRGQQVGTMSAAALSTIGMMVGGPIGAAVGAVIGTAIGYFTDPEGLANRTARVGTNPGGNYSYQATSAFGTFGTFDDRWFSDKDMGDQMRQFFKQQAEIENAIARIMTADQRAQAASGLAGARDYSFGMEHGDIQGLTEIRRDRLAVIVDSLLPGMGDLVKQFEGTSDELVKMIDSLIMLKDVSTDVESIIAELSGDKMAAFTRGLKDLSESVDVAETAFATALEARDPTQILSTYQTLQQAVVNRYQTEMQWIEQIQTGMRALKEDAYQFQLAMAERMNRVGGNVNVGAISYNRFNALRSGYDSGADAGARMTDIGNFLGAVDNWVNAETERVQREQAAAVQASQAIAAAQQAATQSQIDGLQKQLDLSQKWQGVLNNVEQVIDRMRLSGSSPMDAFGRLSMAGSDVESLFSQFQGATGEGRVELASKLLAAVQTRTGLREQTLQRPSDAFSASYNRDMEILSHVRDVAKTEAEKQTDLQNRIATLQASANQYAQISADAGVAANAALESIHAQARAQYEWANREYEIANAEQQALLERQLQAITGGMDVDLYMASRLNDVKSVLESIDARIAAFLTGAATTAATGGTGGAGAGSGAGSGSGAGGGVVVQQPVVLQVNERELGRVVATFQNNWLDDNSSMISRKLGVV